MNNYKEQLDMLIRKMNNSFWLYWYYYFAIWVQFGSPKNFLKDPLKVFIDEETEAERLAEELNKKRNSVTLNITADTDKFNKDLQKVKTSLQRDKKRMVKVISKDECGTIYKEESDIDLEDVIVGYAIYDNITDMVEHKEFNPVKADEWEGFGGAEDNFQGAGAGGSWSEDKILDDQSLGTFGSLEGTNENYS